jgi:putative flippase GtrA
MLAAEFRSNERVPSDPPNLVAQVVRFAGIGAASTVAYLLLFISLRSVMAAQAANAAALLLTAVANTAANRRYTFGLRDPAHRWRHHAQALAIFGAALLLTSGSLGVLHAADPHPGRMLEAGVLVAANLAATVLRFVLLRSWVFADRRRTNPIHPPPAALAADRHLSRSRP